MRPWAAIFDWDGVIIDSSRQHELAWEQLAVREGKRLPQGFFLRSFGMKNERVIPELLGWTQDSQEIADLSFRKETIYRELMREQGVQALPGVVPWLKALQVAGVSCAIGSSTPRLNIDCVIETLGLQDYFRLIVAAEDVRLGKPNPEVFLTAATRLGQAPTQCVVFEDAHVGIEAALAARMRVVGVATTHPADSLKGAHRVVNQLDELSVEEMADWFEASPTAS